MGADEWDDWQRFHGEVDLPDGFLVTGRLGALIDNVLGGKGVLGDFAPYFKAFPQGKRPSNLPQAFAFLKANVPEKQR